MSVFKKMTYQEEYVNYSDKLVNFLYIVSSGSLSIYAFTLGYMDALRIPSIPSLSESVYFFSSLIISHLIQEATFFYWVAFLYIFFCLIFSLPKIKRKKLNIDLSATIDTLIEQLKDWGLLVSITITFLFIQFISIKNRDLNFQHLWKDGIYLYYPIDQNIFIWASLLSVVNPIIASIQFGNSKSKNKILLFSLTVCFSFISSYNLSKKYSPYYVKLPDIRISEKSDVQYKLAWSSGSSKILIDCRFKSQILIMEKDNGSTNYVNFLDAKFAKSICERRIYKNFF